MVPSRDVGPVDNVITLRDIFEKLQQVAEGVAVLREDARLHASVAADHEKRLREIERRIWALPSIATVIALVSLALALYDRLSRS
jgi:hypothetical protein